MSKVIRISESIFEQLQQLAEPLVDTPASVIERLLDQHNQKTNMVEPMRLNKVKETAPLGSVMPRNIFLAPASEENVRASIVGAVSLSTAKHHLSDRQMETLRDALEGDEQFHCWAMTESNRATFESMRSGDIVMLSLRGEGLFNYIGDVVTTFESASLGNALWSITPGRPWNLVYVLDEIKAISTPKVDVVREFGYDPNYVVPGVIRVDPERVAKAARRHGSYEELIRAIC